MRRVFRYLQIDAVTRRSPSACAEIIFKKNRTVQELIWHRLAFDEGTENLKIVKMLRRTQAKAFDAEARYGVDVAELKASAKHHREQHGVWGIFLATFRHIPTANAEG